MMRATAALTALLLWGCSTGPDLATLRQRPEDFTIAVAVHNPKAARGTPPALRPARFVFEADGTLRYASSPAARGWPPPVRTLPPSVQDEFWRLVRDSGLLERDSPYRAFGPVEIDAANQQGALAVFDIAYAGAQARTRVPLDRATDEAVLAETIVRRLTELAWVRE